MLATVLRLNTLLLGLMVLIPAALFAQKKVETAFYSVDWTKTDSSKARFKVNRLFSDVATGAATAQAVDLSTGKPRYMIRYANIYQGVKHGPELHYYADGSLKIRAFYSKGVLIDTLRTYYPSQQLRRVDAYQDGKRIGGTCRDESGNELECPPLTIPPELLNDLRKLMRDLRYPVAARAAGIEGRVMASFIVYADGTFSSPWISKALHPALDAEVLRVLNASKLRFKPGTIEGEPVDMRYNWPVVFKVDQ
jgi:TonB family protein